MGFSPARVGAIALNTFVEALRQKVFNILLVFALVVIASASFFAQYSFGDSAGLEASYQLKSIKDICFGAMSFIGMLIAIVGTAMLLPSEVENRTIYTILAKPVRRFEFLLGKYLGSVLLLFMSLLLMSTLFGAVLAFKGHRLLGELAATPPNVLGVDTPADVERLLGQVRAEAYDVDVIKGVLAIFLMLDLLAAVTLVVSTFSTSMVFNVAIGAMVWIMGNLVGTARELLAAHKVVLFLLAAIPDLVPFSVADEIAAGSSIPWSHIGQIALYGLSRIVILVLAAHFLFSRREI